VTVNLACLGVSLDPSIVARFKVSCHGIFMASMPVNVYSALASVHAGDGNKYRLRLNQYHLGSGLQCSFDEFQLTRGVAEE